MLPSASGQLVAQRSRLLGRGELLLDVGMDADFFIAHADMDDKHDDRLQKRSATALRMHAAELSMRVIR
jgi:hypothetical protein